MHARLAETAPDLRHVDAWIFDLDNTLYRADSDLFAQIDVRMASYVSALLSVPLDEARRIQKDYYRDHGTTLSGLMKVHAADPEPFLEHAHDIDLSVLAPDPKLNENIARLPGRRFVLTNGCRNYAQRVLDRIGPRRSIRRHLGHSCDGLSPQTRSAGLSHADRAQRH